MSINRPPPNPVALWLALAAVYVIWGSTYLGIRIVVEYLPAFGSAALRFGAAGVVLGLILVATRGWRALRVTWRQFGTTVLVGILLIAGGNGLVVLAEAPRFGLPSGIAALLVALNPLLLVLLRLAAGDRPRVLSVVGVLVGLTGLVLLFLPGSGTTVPIGGAVVMLVAVTCWAVGSFGSRFLPMPANPFVAAVYEMFAGSTAMVLLAIGTGEPAPWAVPDVPARVWWALLYLFVAGSIVAFTAYVWLLHNAPISLGSTYGYVNPVIALGLGALFAGEVLTGRVLAAVGVVILGVILVVSVERPRPVNPESP
jgi:drug/metabolite transporter (DMT)-like permease